MLLHLTDYIRRQSSCVVCSGHADEMQYAQHHQVEQRMHLARP